MTIFPRAPVLGKNKNVVLHMKVSNGSAKRVSGRVSFVISAPDGKEEKLEKEITVPPMSSVNEYFTYDIRDKRIGKYVVDGRFFWGRNSCRSETVNNDFFILTQKEVLACKDEEKSLAGFVDSPKNQLPKMGSTRRRCLV